MAERDPVSMSEVPEAARKYVEYLRHELHVSEMYLFGSYVRGNTHADSDIDIAVVSDSFSGDPINDLTMLLLFKSKIDNRIEPHPFLPKDFTKDNPFAKEILESGVRIA